MGGRQDRKAGRHRADALARMDGVKTSEKPQPAVQPFSLLVSTANIRSCSLSSRLIVSRFVGSVSVSKRPRKCRMLSSTIVRGDGLMAVASCSEPGHGCTARRRNSSLVARWSAPRREPRGGIVRRNGDTGPHVPANLPRVVQPSDLAVVRSSVPRGCRNPGALPSAQPSK